LHQDDGKYIVTAEVPGYNKENISITTRGNVLTLEAKEEDSSDEDNNRYHRKRSFKSSIRLPRNVQMDTASASASDGVLSISFDHLPAIEERKVEIQ